MFKLCKVLVEVDVCVEVYVMCGIGYLLKEVL